MDDLAKILMGLQRQINCFYKVSTTVNIRFIFTKAIWHTNNGLCSIENMERVHSPDHMLPVGVLEPTRTLPYQVSV